MGVTLTGEEFAKKQKKAQEDLLKAQEKKGAEFDKAYMKMMVKEHEQDVKEVEKAAKDAKKGNQAQLASFLETTHGHLRMHLDEAKRVESSLGKGGAQAGTGPASGGARTAPSSTGSGSGGTMGPGGAAGAHGGSVGGSGGTHPGSSTDTGGAGTSGSGASGSSGAMGGGTSGSSSGSGK
jgi:putative membrane protein